MLFANLQADKLTRPALFAAWLAVLVITVLVYYPGLAGPFLFDDFGSIAALGELGGVDNWETFRTFVFGGHAGPTGRPLALLSFLVDGNNWPTDAWPFKRTNLVIHLLTGILLGALTRSILRELNYSQEKAHRIALVAAGLWLLHPFLVSTTLYAVQRMAQLSTLFVFAGMMGHLYGRSLLLVNTRKAYIVMTLSMGVFTILASISKENGILLPLLIGVLELTVFANRRAANLNRYWTWGFILAPSAIIAMYLVRVTLTQNFFDITPPRDFSIYERFLTQSRILFDYLQNWFLPKLFTVGVFQDHYTKSTGILSPPTTLLSMLLHALIVAACVRYRRKLPLLAFSVLFFYAGHLLESTVVNLELYFEHRNYLPAAFLFLPLVAALERKTGKTVFVAVAVASMLLLGGFTRYSATLWSDYSTMVAATARKAPTSARAQTAYAVDLYDAGRLAESLDVLERAILNRPNNGMLRLAKSSILCQLGVLDNDEIAAMAAVVSNEAYDPRSVRIYSTLTLLVVEGACPEVSKERLLAMFERMLDLPINGDPRSMRFSQIQYFIGFIHAYSSNPERALAAFDASLDSRPGAGHAMMMAAVMAGRSYHDEALYLSDRALAQLAATPASMLARELVRESDIMEFRATVQADKEADAIEP